ncbi:hypothetical protein BS50DRAFT_658744 [Corynespora cassiicola Philippines]|uniref:F-box domain-containing protein n=1 Tax=Corynespora cassiicola Philippines TaxID=1448308 RepID=A0A2T2N1M8_CORCC|nr:hypothetical protein BS50DRAFT_658744 [Corynespora cassiicola Philippines]
MDKKRLSKNSKPSSLMRDPGKASGLSKCLKRICYTSPSTRKRAETSAAKEQFFANITSSTLCKLPVELILMIGNFATDADLLSLSVSCRLFRSILAIESEKRPPLPATERKEFHKKLNKDLFSAMARVESSSRAAKPRKLLCSFCLVKHPKRMFGKDAALESPFTRACRASTALLPVCEHRSLTFAEIQDLLSKSEDKTCVRLCNHGGHCPAHMTVSTTPISMSEIFKMGEQDFTWVVHSYSKPLDEAGRRYFFFLE